MALLSNSDYAQKLIDPEIKAALPTARGFALSRNLHAICTTDVFCAIVCQDEEILHKLKEKYQVDEAKLQRGLKWLGSDAASDPVDEFEELEITPRVDAAFRLASLSTKNITSRDLLRSLLQDGQSELVGYLMNLGVIPYCSPAPWGSESKEVRRALNNLEEFLLGKPEKYY